jgi:ABC-type branched-subunit amino acid transport system ATPase component
MTALLEVREVTKRFGGLTAVRNVTFSLQRGELTGILGPNGAGKTTLFNVLTGFMPPTSGTVLFNGEPIYGLENCQSRHRTHISAGPTVRWHELTGERYCTLPFPTR